MGFRQDVPPKPGLVSAEAARKGMVDRQREQTLRILAGKPVTGVASSDAQPPAPRRMVSAEEARRDMIARSTR